jgi:hypothetical protein
MRNQMRELADRGTFNPARLVAREPRGAEPSPQSERSGAVGKAGFPAVAAEAFEDFRADRGLSGLPPPPKSACLDGSPHPVQHPADPLPVNAKDRGYPVGGQLLAQVKMADPVRKRCGRQAIGVR